MSSYIRKTLLVFWLLEFCNGLPSLLLPKSKEFWKEFKDSNVEALNILRTLISVSKSEAGTGPNKKAELYYADISNSYNEQFIYFCQNFLGANLVFQNDSSEPQGSKSKEQQGSWDSIYLQQVLDNYIHLLKRKSSIWYNINIFLVPHSLYYYQVLKLIYIETLEELRTDDQVNVSGYKQIAFVFRTPRHYRSIVFEVDKKYYPDINIAIFYRAEQKFFFLGDDELIMKEYCRISQGEGVEADIVLCFMVDIADRNSKSIQRFYNSVLIDPLIWYYCQDSQRAPYQEMIDYAEMIQCYKDVLNADEKSLSIFFEGITPLKIAGARSHKRYITGMAKSLISQDVRRCKSDNMPQHICRNVMNSSVLKLQETYILKFNERFESKTTHPSNYFGLKDLLKSIFKIVVTGTTILEHYMEQFIEEMYGTREFIKKLFEKLFKLESQGEPSLASVFIITKNHPYNLHQWMLIRDEVLQVIGIEGVDIPVYDRIKTLLAAEFAKLATQNTDDQKILETQMLKLDKNVMDDLILKLYIYQMNRLYGDHEPKIKFTFLSLPAKLSIRSKDGSNFYYINSDENSIYYFPPMSSARYNLIGYVEKYHSVLPRWLKEGVYSSRNPLITEYMLPTFYIYKSEFIEALKSWKSQNLPAVVDSKDIIRVFLDAVNYIPEEDPKNKKKYTFSLHEDNIVRNEIKDFLLQVYNKRHKLLAPTLNPELRVLIKEQFYSNSLTAEPEKLEWLDAIRSESRNITEDYPSYLYFQSFRIKLKSNI